MKHGVLLIDWFSDVGDDTRDKIVDSVYELIDRKITGGGVYLETDDKNVIEQIQLLCEEGNTDKEIERLKAKIKALEDKMEEKIEILEEVIEDLRTRN